HNGTCNKLAPFFQDNPLVILTAAQIKKPGDHGISRLFI
ncbi:MAG: hypothetical protein ACI95X_001128, partial [Paraglaciecola sp.]